MRIVKRLAFALAVVAGMMGAPAAFATYPGTRPPDGTTQGQPFAPGTGGSANFRIPAMVTLDNGTVVAATDARWNTTGDAGGLDTIVSHSTDNGATWNYTFANYLGDNGNTYNGASTTFIDPALATDGQTVYMVTDFFPAGIAIARANWTPQMGDGFDDAGHLRLRSADEVEFDCADYAVKAAKASYDYYLDLDALTIHNASDGSEVPGYTVDGQLNITDSAGATTNLFCGDAPFQVFPTTYLQIKSSTDAGATWSDPTLINVKESNEQVVIVGPGTGTVLEDGTLVFSVYEYTNGTQVSSIIYSNDGGKSWKRSCDATDRDTHWSSEAVTIDMGNGVIRQFYRDNCTTLFYTDYTLENGVYVPGEPVDSGTVKTYNNQLSAIRYSKQIDGHDAIIASMASAGTRSRTSGKLHVGLIEDDGSITWKYLYDMVPDGSFYAYSSLAELADGSIAVLYEEADATERYMVIPIDQIVCDDTNVNLAKRDIALSVGESVTLRDYSGDCTQGDAEGLNTDVATLSRAQGEPGEACLQLGTLNGYGGSRVALSDATYTFASNGDGTYSVHAQAADGSTVYLAPSDGNVGYPNSKVSARIGVSPGNADNTVYLRDDKGSYLYFDRTTCQFDRVNNVDGDSSWPANCSWALYRAAHAGEQSSAELPGYVAASLDGELEDGDYLIVATAGDGSRYVLYPSLSAASKSDQAAKVVASADVPTVLTFTGVAPGTTTVLVGSTRYTVTVTGEVRELAFPGGEKILTVEVPGSYAADDLSGLDPSVATGAIEQADRVLASDGSEIALEDCLYTFAADGSGGFTAYGTLPSGEQVWLSPTGQGVGLPWSDHPVKLRIASGAADGLVTINDTQSYLYCKDGVLDRVGSTSGHDGYTSFELYRPVDSDGRSARSAREIEGFERVASADDVTDGTYLVASQQGGTLHVLRPSNADARADHLATAGKKSVVTLTAVGSGTTGFRLGDTSFVVTVPNGAGAEEPGQPGAEEQPAEPDVPGTGENPDESGQAAQPDASAGEKKASDGKARGTAVLPRTADAASLAGVAAAVGAVAAGMGIASRRRR